MSNPKTTIAGVLSAVAGVIQGVVIPLLNDAMPSSDQVYSAFTLVMLAAGLFFAADANPKKPAQ